MLEKKDGQGFMIVARDTCYMRMLIDEPVHLSLGQWTIYMSAWLLYGLILGAIYKEAYSYPFFISK